MIPWFDRFVRRHMNAVRVARWGLPGRPAADGPLVVYTNHPAWWDAAILILVAERFFPDRENFAPFDAAMLEKYGVFARMGAFPVDLASARGGAQFLSASRAILERPGRALWVTAQGRFADVRTRPLGLKPGIARLAEVAPNARFLPLALDYAFWDERGAEACLAFGPALTAAELLALPRPERLARLESDLTATLDRLSADVMTREPDRFETLVAGRRGVGGVYDGWRRFAAALAGRRFQAGHRDGEAGADAERRIL